MKDITPIVRNGTPPGERPGVLTFLIPPTTESSTSPVTTVSAAPLMIRVDRDAGRTVVNAVPTKYTDMSAATTFVAFVLLRNSRIDALAPMTTMA
jgi:hypothetical protein